MDGKDTQRSEDFSNKRPLPPISTREENSQTTDRSQEDDDARSNTSNNALDRPTESTAGPRIMRGFRPEVMTDDDTDDDNLHRSVSFTNNPPVTLRRKAFDGRETTFVTLETQTDWDWVEHAEETGTARTINTDTTAPPGAEKDKSSLTPRSGSSKQETPDVLKHPDVQQLSMPYNDEYGIPILDLSSDTDDSSDEEVTHKKMKDDRTFLPSVGPPNILQYQRESKQQDIDVDEPESRIPKPNDLDVDENGVPFGMYTGRCEFCNQEIKPFPTKEQQLKYPPESLYCCHEYREFVEFVVNTNTQLEDEQKKKTKLISVKPHEHVGSKQERNAAKEKAVQRMREREMARKQLEASGIQQNFLASGQVSPSKVGLQRMPGGIGNVTMKDMYAERPAPISLSIVGGGASTSTPKRAVNTMSLLEGSAAFARQMKTINYQLSSQKCLEEGWTLRAPSPLIDDDVDDVFIPEPLNPAMIEDGKRTMAYRPDSGVLLSLLRHRPLIEKFYDNGQKFLTMFPDGTGNVFYPSGNLAILISSVKLGQYYYTIHQDIKRSGVVAAFEPNGYGYCYYPNGDIRLYIDQYGGMELDSSGGKKKKWSWKDQVVHVHAPPFQPICIGVNKNMGLRLMSQENISLTFSCNRRGCRFNMGSRLKLIAPENAPLKEVQEEYIFLEEKKNYVQGLLDKVENLLKFPNHPKVDKMLPPLHMTSKINKTEKMKKDRKLYLAQQAAKDKRQNPVAVN